MIQVNEPRNKLHPRYHRSILPLLLVESSSHLTTNDLYPNLIEHLEFETSEYFLRGYSAMIVQVIRNLAIFTPFASDSLKSLKKRVLGEELRVSCESYSNCRYTSLTLRSLHSTELNDSTAYR